MKTSINFLFLLCLVLKLHAQIVQPIGTGLTLHGEVHDIAIDSFSNSYYVVGDFTGIDNTKASNVALYRNDVWEAIPDSTQIEGRVLCAEVYQNELYIGGNFTINKESKITNLAKLKNGNWVGLDIDFMSGSIRDLTWHKEELFVTGDFRAINGINNDGIMKYAEGIWQDAGLDSEINAKELLSSNNRLYAWGNGFSGDGDGYSHTLSYLENGNWNSLPNPETEPSVTTAFVIYRGDIYITVENAVYVYDFDQIKWVKVSSSFPSGNNAQLLEHDDKLIIVFDNIFYQIENGTLSQMGFQTLNNYYFEQVNVVKSINGALLVGGNFVHWESKSLSLSKIELGSIISQGQVASHITYRGSFNYSVATSIIKYNDKYLIGGRFSFADDIYSPNLVYWDGTEFSPFETPIHDGIRKMLVFENELYAIPFLDNRLVKFDGSNWIDIPTPLLSFDDMEVINDKLFIMDDYQFSLDGGPHYYKENVWSQLKEFEPDGSIPWYEFGDIRGYQDGYLLAINSYPIGDRLIYLASDSSEWQLVDTLGFEFDNFYIFQNQIYFVDRFDSIYTLNGEDEVLLAGDVETSGALFFLMDDEVHYSAWNEGTYRLEDDNSLEYFNYLRIRDIEQIEENKYLIASQTDAVSHGLEFVPIRNIGLLTFEDLEVNLELDEENICEQHYVQFWPETQHIDLEYQWKFAGGIPNESDKIYPMVKYPNSGEYTAQLIAKNELGDTVRMDTEVSVEICQELPELEDHYDNHWIMGNEFGRNGLGGFDFSLEDTIMSPRRMTSIEMNEGSTVMSDSKGNLQFYSNGFSILDKDNQPILGSECFNQDVENYSPDYLIGYQSVLGLPAVNQDSVYHLFDLDYITPAGQFYGAGLNLGMTTVDMRREEGKGEVVNCNELIIDDILLRSTMQATRHANGIDWWIIVGKYDSDTYYRLLLTSDGISLKETGNWGVLHQGTFSGQTSFSPDGRYFAQVIEEDQNVNIWRFDNQTGILSDLQIYTVATVDDIEYPRGCSFSPDSRFLYVSSMTQLRQIDLCDFNELDVEMIATWDGSYQFIYPLFFGKQMMTPDQQIVVTPTGNSHYSFGVIEAPNNKGMSCNFKQHTLDIHKDSRNVGDVISVFPHFRSYPSHDGECSVGISDEAPEEEFYVYPNPTDGASLLHLNRTASGSLFNIEGQQILSFENSNYLDIYALPPGMFIIKSQFGTTRFFKVDR